MDGEALLQLDDVRVQFGTFRAVDGVSLTLRAGELLGFVGPNGAGKTTTLRAAAGLQPIVSGKIRVFGHDVFADPAAAARHLAFTPDTPALYDGLTVTQFLDFVGRMYGFPAAARQERSEYWLEQLWLSDKRTAKVQTLSRGMRQRLAVARSLLGDPHVLLLDEPAAGLDPAGRVQFRRLLASLRDQGRAIVISSHILADLADYCTHILIMEHGRVLRHGTVAEITGSAVHARGYYDVVLVQRVGDLAARLADLPGVTVVRAEGDRVTLEYETQRAAAAQLLQQLLARGLPIAEFAAHKPDLEQAYLRSGIAQVD